MYDEFEEQPESLNSDLYFQARCAEYDSSDAEEALAAAISHVATLSRVDGLVLMDGCLNVVGFGTEIITKGNSKILPYLANHASPTKAKISKLDIERFGTRHRSMVRYCTTDENACGFVVSSDGPVRSIARTGKRVYFWPNVQLGLVRGARRA